MHIDLYGSKMHYIEQGTGDPILFLHGIPTSSYVWRNIIPHLSLLGRCIAPDLMGMGKSDKPDITYNLVDHIKYIENFIEMLHLKNITLVMHGWGSIIGLDYAMRHPDKCKGLVFYESYLRSHHADDISLPFQEQIAMMHGKYSVDKALSQAMIQVLDTKTMNAYQEPFLKPGSDRPLQQYLKELPQVDKSVNKLIGAYSQKLMQSALPKLMLYSVPGFLTTIETVMWAKENIKNLEVADIGEELHYAQESDPKLMSETISIWLQALS